jgi:peptidoglycan/LPS O-acetylase OafA/YrhL
MELDRWSLLALARFVLASIVALSHLAEYTDLGAMAFITRLGAFEAVLGFLFISGYSVTSSYLSRPNGFLRRRLLRLYPVYAASLLITLAVTVFVRGENVPSLTTILMNGLFLNQLLTDTSLVGPAWSLSLEFWLYCSLPYLLIAGTKVNRRAAYISFAAYVSYTAMRTLLRFPYYSGLGYGVNLIVLAFAWICGSRLAQLDADRKQALKDARIFLSAHILLAATIQLGSRIKRHTLDQFFGVDLPNFGFQALTLLALYLLLRQVTRSQPPVVRSSRALQVVGDISYPLYLIHIPVFIAATRLGIASPHLNFAIAVGMAWLVYLVFDYYSRHRAKSGLQPSAPIAAQ